MINIHYSIIIPHYNTPTLLKRCLESIPVRDDLEIIVVDDVSDADLLRTTYDICKPLPRVRLIRSEKKGGAGHARNIGLSHAIGEWVLFADADDFFENTFWSKIDNIISGLSSKVDVCYFKLRSLDSEKLTSAIRGQSKNLRVDNYLKRKRYSEFFLRLMHVSPYGKIIRRRFICYNNIKFDETFVANDVMFSTRVGYAASQIAAFDIVMYIVTVRDGSLTSFYDKDSLRCRFEVAVKQNAYLNSLEKSFYSNYLVPSIIRSYNLFGFHEMIRYLKILRNYKVSVFSGIRRKIVMKIVK